MPIVTLNEQFVKSASCPIGKSKVEYYSDHTAVTGLVLEWPLLRFLWVGGIHLPALLIKTCCDCAAGALRQPRGWCGAVGAKGA